MGLVKVMGQVAVRPFTEPGSTPGLACRVYWTPEALAGLPTLDAIGRVLMAAAVLRDTSFRVAFGLGEAFHGVLGLTTATAGEHRSAACEE
ncbi:hypothetical protein [Streptomyces sp. NPDC005498]|uniref:hypothetical protein n=1 Tax=Streptomyces sp. NPDC005498 TaxID=3364717 RepID=UPI0036861C99